MLKVATQKFHFSIYKNLQLNALTCNHHTQDFSFFKMPELRNPLIHSRFIC